MTINYIPNDPLAVGDLPMVRKKPRPDRPANRAGYIYSQTQPEGIYGVGTPGFLFWQCREAALQAVRNWEALIGGNFNSWISNKKKLRLRQNAGNDLNAYYDRSSLSFFEFTTGSKTTYSGASSDVVFHEAGHALLDQIRPDLWSSFYAEVGAFHEAFGDCFAVLSGLSTSKARQTVLANSPSLSSMNFLEATAEDLSDGVRRELGAQHPAAAPRHAFNSFQWQLPGTLPSFGPPSQLTSEVHSFARVFTGCLWDTLANVYASQLNPGQVALKKAGTIVGKLLVAGAQAAPDEPRFFRAVGRSMILADQQLNGGKHHLQIRDGFAAHNISLGSSAMLAPTAMLAGAAPKLAKATSILSPTTKRDLLERIGAKGGKLTIKKLLVAGKKVAQAIHHREIKLSQFDSRLKGVVAMAAEPILVGAESNRSAILGALPQAAATMDEVACFVHMLLDHDCIAFKKATSAVATAASAPGLPTHAIKKRGSKKVLTRMRIACRGGRCASHGR